MTSPRSVRFHPDVQRRLASYVARHPGTSASSMAARLVDEGLRMEEHPASVFRDGPAGRRATLVAGPDVWEVVRAVQSARAGEPELANAELLALLKGNTGVGAPMLRAALDYWSAYPEDVEVMVAHAEEALERAAAAHTSASRSC